MRKKRETPPKFEEYMHTAHTGNFSPSEEPIIESNQSYGSLTRSVARSFASSMSNIRSPNRSLSLSFNSINGSPENENVKSANGIDNKGHSELRTMSWGQAAFNLFFYMFGASQVPYAIAQMGWGWGPVFLVALCLSSFLSGHVRNAMLSL